MKHAAVKAIFLQAVAGLAEPASAGSRPYGRGPNGDGGQQGGESAGVLERGRGRAMVHADAEGRLYIRTTEKLYCIAR